MLEPYENPFLGFQVQGRQRKGKIPKILAYLLVAPLVARTLLGLITKNIGLPKLLRWSMHIAWTNVSTFILGDLLYC